VFPDTERQPTELDKRYVITAIPGDIPVQLRLPPGSIGFGKHAVVRATVPEAAVEEHSDLCPRERYVGSTRKSAQMFPESQPETVEFAAQTHLAG
jgi:hypothetical protein